MKPTKVEISSKTIVFTVFFLLALWLLYQIRSILILIFIAFILMTAINPIVTLGRRKKIPVLLIMLVVYLGVIALFSFVVASLVPAVIN